MLLSLIRRECFFPLFSVCGGSGEMAGRWVGREGAEDGGWAWARDGSNGWEIKMGDGIRKGEVRN